MCGELWLIWSWNPMECDVEFSARLLVYSTTKKKIDFTNHAWIFNGKPYQKKYLFKFQYIKRVKVIIIEKSFWWESYNISISYI